MIFISSPYSHPDKAVVERRVIITTKYCGKMLSLGQAVVSPIVYGHAILPHYKLPDDYAFWENFCVALLTKCDEIHVLKIDGWELSKGMKEELDLAKKFNYRIKYIEPSELEF